MTGAAEEWGQGGGGGLAPPILAIDRTMICCRTTDKYMYSINIPGIPPGGTFVYRSAILTSLLHLTMHTNRLVLGPNFQGLIIFSGPKQTQARGSKGCYSMAVSVVSTEDYT